MAVASGFGTTANGSKAQASGIYSTAIGANSNAIADHSIAIGNNSIADEAHTVSFGNADYQRRLTNIADGRIYSGSSDAVTGNQLWDVYRNMDDLREDVNVVGAHAAALSGLHPIQYNPYEPTTLSAAVGAYRDEYAVAVGVFHYTRENVMFNLGASLCSDGDVMGRAGVSFAVGKSSDKKPRLASTMGGLQKQVLDMQAKLDGLEKKNARSEEIIRQNAEIMAQNEKLIRELTKRLEAKR